MHVGIDGDDTTLPLFVHDPCIHRKVWSRDYHIVGIFRGGGGGGGKIFVVFVVERQNMKFVPTSTQYRIVPGYGTQYRIVPGYGLVYCDTKIFPRTGQKVSLVPRLSPLAHAYDL